MERKKYRIGLVMKSLKADFFKVMQKGAEEFAASDGGFQLISTGTDSQTEIDRQVALVDELSASGVDALVVVPIDSKALVAPVVRAVRRGVKVVNIDIRLDESLLSEAGVDVDFVGPDNFAAASEVGCLLAEKLEKGAPVAIIEGLPVADNARQRKAGFDKAVAERGLDCKESVPANWETHTAREVFGPILAGHPEIKAVFCCNDAMALGVIDILKEAGKKPGEIKVVGFDNDDVMRPLLDEGWLLGTVDAYGSQMAVEGIRHALSLLAGGQASLGNRPTPYTVIKR